MSMLASVDEEAVRTVLLYGRLGELFGRKHRLVVTSVGEVIRALGELLPGFKKYMTQAAADKQEFACLHGTRRIGPDRLREWLDDEDPIRIAPIIKGSKRGGLFQIVLGAVIIAAAVVMGPAGGFAATFSAGGVAGGAAWMGAAMVLSGAAAAISPTPSALSSGDPPDNKASYGFNGPVNVPAQGNPFPLGYSDADGFFWAGSVVMAQGIYSEDRQ
ncbi:tail assembly protein [Achromobacter xylosoxidans]|nr:tail assembly protein [Achromobacter xylosoxidans]